MNDTLLFALAALVVAVLIFDAVKKRNRKPPHPTPPGKGLPPQADPNHPEHGEWPAHAGRTRK